MQFVIFHGSFGTPQENWFPYLKENLEKLGQEVLIPQFPIDDWDNVVAKGEEYTSSIQNLTNWLKTCEEDVLPRLKEKPVFIGHSIACLLILHAVEKYSIQLDSALFVSPFLSKLAQSEFNTVNGTFYKTDFDFEKLKKLIPLSYALYSDNDPYVGQDKFKEWQNLVDSKSEIIPHGGHLNSKAGFTQLPLLLDLCKTRISTPDVEALCH